MTTYTLSGFTADTNGGSHVSVANTFSLVIVARDAMDSFSYSYVPDRLEEVNMVGFNPYSMEFDGISIDAIHHEPGDVPLIFSFDWGDDKNSIVWYFTDNISGESGGATYHIQLGGDPLPEISTATEYNAWADSLTGVGQVTSGPFAPGMDIDLDTLPGVTVTEHDIIFGDASANKFHGGVGRDVIRGKGGADKLFGDKGHDRLYGGNDNDRLFGGDGNDIMYGMADNDHMYGNSGKDSMFGGDGADNLHGALGDDILRGEAGKDYLYGGNGNDALRGGVNNDKLYGQANDDWLYGGAGEDVLFGGNGDDLLKGGAGADLFVFVGLAGLGHDTIADFKDGVDRIWINEGPAFSDLSFSQVGADTLISWVGTSVTLLGIDMVDITSDDIIAS